MPETFFPYTKTANNVILYTVSIPKASANRTLTVSVPFALKGEVSNTSTPTTKTISIACSGGTSGAVLRDNVYYSSLSLTNSIQYTTQNITTTALASFLTYTIFWGMISSTFAPPIDIIDRTYTFTCSLTETVDAGAYNGSFNFYPTTLTKNGFLINVNSGGAGFSGFTFASGYSAPTNYSAISFTNTLTDTYNSFINSDIGRIGKLVVSNSNNVCYGEANIITSATTLSFPLNTLYSVSNASGAFTITLPRITASNVGTEITFRKSVALSTANSISFLANYTDTYLYKLGSDASFNTAQALMANTVYSITFVAMNKTTGASPTYGWFQTYVSGSTAVPQTVDDYTCYSNIAMDIGAVWNYSVLPTAPIIPTTQFQLINKYYVDNNLKSNTAFDASYNELKALLPSAEVIFRTTNANFTMTTFPSALIWNLASSGTAIQCYLPTITTDMIGKRCVFKKYNQTTNYSLTINAPSGVSMVVSNNGVLVSTITLGNTSYLIELMVVSTTLILGL